MAGRIPRPHRELSRYLCKLRDWAHPSPTLLGFQLYAVSGRAHFCHRPMQLRAIHRGWAHSQPFGGNVSAFNANATSQASMRFAQLVCPHGYCWYPPARFNPLKVCHTKLDRMRSMGICPLNSVVCRRMATKLPRKLPNAFLYAKLKSFRGVHIQLLAEIGG